ncbi:MAG TPA: hypothetical protein VK166_06875 [Chitinophagaceae bacterium]|nr:hypothetical protein [Chitinophagaceae bacterium]
MEYQNRTGADVWGPRINVQKAFNPNNMAIVEVPFQFNTETGKFGISDLRVRYFNVLKRNISRKFIALAAFTDITAPTGKYENGFGTSNWSLAFGVITGFTFSKRFSFFPGISYIHLTKPTTESIPDQFKTVSDGIGLQFNASIILNKSTFIFINPIPSFLNTNGDWNSNWLAEFSLNKIIKPNKFKINISYNPNFNNGNYILRLGATVFL